MNAGGEAAAQVLQTSVDLPGEALSAAEAARQHAGAEIRVRALVDGEVLPLERPVERIELARHEGDPEWLGRFGLELDLIPELPPGRGNRREVDVYLMGWWDRPFDQAVDLMNDWLARDRATEPE